LGWIFIGYAHDDATFAGRLKVAVQAGGFPAWMDTASMVGGERWTQEVESAIQHAVTVGVVVSRSTNESTWVRREILCAQQLGKQVIPGAIADLYWFLG
jgi:hypothetical protein